MKQLAWRARVLFIALFAFLPAKAATPEYSIQAIRCANSPGDSVADLVMGEPKDEKIDTVYVIWLIRGGGRNILLDSGSHLQKWFKYGMTDYLQPDEAVKLAANALGCVYLLPSSRSQSGWRAGYC